MNLSQLHVSHPNWLWALLVIPLVWGLVWSFHRDQHPRRQLEMFIDKHLIPYLLLGGEYTKKNLVTQLTMWSIVCCGLVLALAGPRWDFREIPTFTRDQSLVILLDISESMNATDVSPSRLERAKQKIEDLLNISTGVKFALIAFAADPHMIVPMTDDKETIRHLLPSLDTDLAYVQGSQLAPALEMVFTLLQGADSNNKAIAVLTDGGFEDAGNAIHTAKRLVERGVVIYSIGVGTVEGSPLKDRYGVIIKKNGSPIVSKLERDKIRALSNLGQGRYFDADHSGQTALIFSDLEKRSDVQQESQKTEHYWNERFYLFLLPVLPLVLWWFRRGYLFVLLLFFAVPSYSQASLNTYFYNTEQQAHQACESGDYTSASQLFHDPYRRGVAYYRTGDYPAAEAMFRQSMRPEVAANAAYNLGNALVQQQKLQEAVTAYEDVLNKWPDHEQAKHNLEVVKKMLEEQQKQSQQDDDQNQQKDSDQTGDQQQEEQKQSNEQPQNEKKADDAPEPEQAKSESSSEQSQEQREKSQQQEQAQGAQEQRERPTERSQENLDADLWLDQIKNDPKSFLKKKFYLESRKNGTQETVDPW